MSAPATSVANTKPTDHSLTNTVATVENHHVTTMVLQTLFSAHDGVRVLFARSRDA